MEKCYEIKEKPKIKFFRNINTISFLIIFVTFLSVDSWSKVPVNNTYLMWLLSFSIVYLIITNKKKFFIEEKNNNYLCVSIFLWWLGLSVIRGIFIAEGYWEYKQLIEGTLSLILPIFVFIFSNPLITQRILQKWIKYALPAFIIFFAWVTTSGSKHHYLGPLISLGCFLPYLNKKWFTVFIIILIMMIFLDFSSRSQVIKSAFSIFASILLFLRSIIPLKIIRLIHWFFYAIPICFLYLGLSGTFNVFKFINNNNDAYVQKSIQNGQLIEDDLTADTRTFIYEEVISSAFKNNYVLFGRTPAKGNDSESFGEYYAEVLNTKKYERFNNEVGFANVFTWLGFIGLLLYTVIYIMSSYYSLYKSKSYALKIVSLFIAFHFFYGWIEDVAEFKISSISLWIMISMGLSSKFREMDDKVFKIWLRSIF